MCVCKFLRMSVYVCVLSASGLVAIVGVSCVCASVNPETVPLIFLDFVRHALTDLGIVDFGCRKNVHALSLNMCVSSCDGQWCEAISVKPTGFVQFPISEHSMQQHQSIHRHSITLGPYFLCFL